MTVASAFFYLFSGVMIASAFMVIAARNPVHSVLFLILAFFNAAGLFLLIGAEFIAMILVIVYVGAVAVLFLFVVMMLDINLTELREGFLAYFPVGALIGAVLFAELLLGVGIIGSGSTTIAGLDMHGAKVMAGQAATIGTYSFFPSKNLGGYGDGGMMVTQDEALFEALMKLRTHGSRRTYFHEIVGYNSRLDALQAAVLRAKLPHLESWSAARRRNAAYYDAAFADLADVATPYLDPANTSIYNQYTIRVPKRDALQAYLKDRGIGCSVYYPLPLHLQPCFAYLGYQHGQCPESERAALEVLSLPVFPELTTAQLDEVIGAVRAFFGR